MVPIYPFFAAVRERLVADAILNATLEKRIYFNLPERPTYPCVVFSVDEVIDNNDTYCIKFNLRLLSLHHKGAESLKIMCAIDAGLELESLMLEGSLRAFCQRMKVLVDKPVDHKPQGIQHFYKALIRRAA